MDNTFLNSQQLVGHSCELSGKNAGLVGELRQNLRHKGRELPLENYSARLDSYEGITMWEWVKFLFQVRPYLERMSEIEQLKVDKIAACFSKRLNESDYDAACESINNRIKLSNLAVLHGHIISTLKLLSDSQNLTQPTKKSSQLQEKNFRTHQSMMEGGSNFLEGEVEMLVKNRFDASNFVEKHRIEGQNVGYLMDIEELICGDLVSLMSDFCSGKPLNSCGDPEFFSDARYRESQQWQQQRAEKAAKMPKKIAPKRLAAQKWEEKKAFFEQKRRAKASTNTLNTLNLGHSINPENSTNLGSFEDPQSLQIAEKAEDLGNFVAIRGAKTAQNGRNLEGFEQPLESELAVKASNNGTKRVLKTPKRRERRASEGKDTQKWSKKTGREGEQLSQKWAENAGECPQKWSEICDLTRGRSNCKSCIKLSIRRRQVNFCMDECGKIIRNLGFDPQKLHNEFHNFYQSFRPN